MDIEVAAEKLKELAAKQVPNPRVGARSSEVRAALNELFGQESAELFPVFASDAHIKIDAFIKQDKNRQRINTKLTDEELCKLLVIVLEAQGTTFDLQAAKDQDRFVDDVKAVLEHPAHDQGTD